ncbi:MAG: ABC transporter permease [Anaerolineales bacterium]|nr:ABC transporter permease [Anaerolineales bacterium]
MERKFTETLVLLAILAGVIGLMWILNGSDFMNLGNFQSMAFQLPELGILSMAMMITMLTAGINLSIIASANLSGIAMALILTETIPPEATGPGGIGLVILAILAGLAVSALVGLLNGYLIAYLEISPILATLGTMILVSGLALAITKGYVISGFPAAMQVIGNGKLLGLPIPILIFAAGVAILSVILRQTPLGSKIYLLGSNPTACFYSGVNNPQVLMRTYLISGLYSGAAAVVMISRFNSAKADYGESYLLLTVLVSVLGGVSAAGGFGRVSGLVLALIILQIISSGLNLMGVNTFLTVALWGSVLILVMVIQYLIDRMQEKRRTT